MTKHSAPIPQPTTVNDNKTLQFLLRKHLHDRGGSQITSPNFSATTTPPPHLVSTSDFSPIPPLLSLCLTWVTSSLFVEVRYFGDTHPHPNLGDVICEPPLRATTISGENVMLGFDFTSTIRNFVPLLTFAPSVMITFSQAQF